MCAGVPPNPARLSRWAALARSHWSGGSGVSMGKKGGYQGVLTALARGSCEECCAARRDPPLDWTLIVAGGSSIYGLTGLDRGVVCLREWFLCSSPGNPLPRRESMRFTNLTRHTEIGANSYLLELGGRRVVLDCGMHPKHEGEDARPTCGSCPTARSTPSSSPTPTSTTSARLPVLMRRQPHARVFMSPPTAQLGEALLHNSVNVMAKPHGPANGNGSPSRQPSGPPPLFTPPRGRPVRAGLAAVRAAATLEPGGRTPRAARGSRRDLRVFRRRAHPGLRRASSSARRASAFSTRGDVNFLDQTVSRAAGFPGADGTPTEPIDVLIIETTRGDHPRPGGRHARRRGSAAGAGIEGGVRARGRGADPGVRAGQDAGNAGDVPAFQAEGAAGRRADLHRRPEHEDDRDLRPVRLQQPAAAAGVVAAAHGRAVRAERARGGAARRSSRAASTRFPAA